MFVTDKSSLVVVGIMVAICCHIYYYIPEHERDVQNSCDLLLLSIFFYNSQEHKHTRIPCPTISAPPISLV
jgi:hypothetical protein